MGNNLNVISSESTPPQGEFKKFNEKELNRLKKVFDALYERFPYKTISHETLYKTFPLPEDLAERLAKSLDTSQAEIIDFQPMLEWLSLYCRGSMQTKMEILFRMYGIGEMIPVRREELEILLRALMTPISKFFTLSDATALPQIGQKEIEYISSMLKVIFEDNEIETDSQDRIRPEDYLDWQKENQHLVDMLERLLQQTRRQKKQKGKGNKDSGSEPNDCEGFLFKVGRTFGNWHERWFVLKAKFLYGYRSDRDRNYNDVIHMDGYTLERLDDRKDFYGFKLTPPKQSSNASNSPKSLYCKTEEDREMWIAALERASGVISASANKPVSNLSKANAPAPSSSMDRTSNSADPRRRISSPRTSPMKRNIKKYMRYDNDKKTKIMENIMYRLDATNNRISKLQTNCHSLKQHMGTSTREIIEEKDRKINNLEAKVLQLEYQLKHKNQFITDLRTKFKQEVETQKQRVKRESQAYIEFSMSKADEELQKKNEDMLIMKDEFKNQLDLAQKDFSTFRDDLADAHEQKINFVKAVAEEMFYMKNHILELEKELEEKSKGWLF